MEQFKIIIAGLDNAGKTSSLIALRQKYNFYEMVKNLRPTIKIEYSSFNFLNKWDVLVWDMGGQSKYRKIYLGKPAYFIDTNFMYYFIDIQDEERISQSINYLNELLKIYQDLEYENEIIICLHKYDPKLRRDGTILKRIQEVKKLIKQNEDFKFKFYRTSIYDISSISKAISFSLNTLVDLTPIHLSLQNFMRQFNGNHIVLYTDDGIILGDYYREVLDTIEYKEKISNKINEDLILIQKLKDKHVEFTERLTNFKDSLEYLKKYEIENNTFYLKINTPDLENEKIQLMKRNFKEFEKDLIIVFEDKK
ncbi:MAG: putative Small Arf-related GTPase [Promethearchaeota archaeon]|nr:MAG: putative Small Arf-related GTPase [Candidatus Lokiarchaeota archaeon]